MRHQLRVQSASGFIELVEALGGNPVALLRHAGLNPDDLARPNAYVPHRNYLHLLEYSAQVLQCPDFGLRLLDRQDLAVLGPVTIAAQYAETLEEAMVCVARYIRFQGSAWRLHLRQQAQTSQMMMVVELGLKRTLPRQQQMDLAIGFAHKVLTLFSNGACRPLEAWFPYSRSAPLTSYRKRFRCPLRFDAPDGGIVINRSDLALPVRESNPAHSAAAMGYLQRIYGDGEPSVSMRVRALIRPLLAVGQCSNQNIAASLAMHPRTLHRHLAKEGWQFDDIKDSVRRELAKELIAQPELSFTQISGSLGYAEQSAFSRSCVRWFGSAPRALRLASAVGKAIG